ncbi:MAG: hypothetical protein RIR51_590 [Bacteroidota bacterium]
MNYPENIEEKLGVKQILNEILEKCVSEMGREFCLKMKFSNNFKLVSQWVRQVDEMKSVLENFVTEFPQSDYVDLRPWLGRVKIEENYLSVEEWREWKRGLTVLHDTIKFFNSLLEDESYPELNSLTQFQLEKMQENEKHFRDFIPIIKELEKVFDLEGNISPSASAALMDIRNKKNAEERGLRKTMDSILSNARKEGWIGKDFSLSIRNGRLVIPIEVEHKRKIRGFVQDESDSGKTVFLEPAEALAANNEIRSLELAERREIIQILTRLTTRVRPLVPLIKQLSIWIGIIDFIRAKAKWAIEHKAISPKMENLPLMDWKNARHPILEKSLKKSGKKIIPLNIRLSEQHRLMVVSGPNAGGKSVTLTTMGINQYLFQMGSLVSMDEGSTIGFFDKIFLDIGDQQNIENELSTYSSHLKNMKYFMENTNAKTLLLVDEFGTGTEPALGGAIAEAILETFADKGSFGAINTHYGNLKNLADKKTGMFNAAMKYDTEHLEPLYELEIGKPGSSFAFEIAQKIGFKQDLLNRAKNKLGKKQVDLDKILLETAAEKQLWESKNAGLAEQERQLEEIKEQYFKLKNSLDENKKFILDQAKKEAKTLIKESNQLIEKTIREIKEKAADKEITKKLRVEIKDHEEKKLEMQPEKKNEDRPELIKLEGNIQIGDWVMLDSGAYGQVSALKGKDFEVVMGSIKTFVKKNKLTKIKTPKQEKNRSFNKGLDLNSKMANFKIDLDIRGKRGEEVFGILDSYVNDAILVGAMEIRIVHGKGDGILRKLVREHLRSFKQIDKIYDEHPDRGGAGVSIVQFN